MKRRIFLVNICAVFLTSLIPLHAANATPNWTLIYQNTNSSRDSGGTSFTYSTGYEKTGTAVTNFSNSGQNWDLIRIRIQFTKASNSTLYYVDAYFDKWAGASLADLQFPDDVNSLVQQRNITNLVVASDYSTVKTGSYALGRIEFWPYNYTQTRSGLSPAGDNSLYDWDDTYATGANGHGSYQLFNLTDTQTVFAWNRHRLGDTTEFGFGPNTSGTGDPDWTFNGVTFNNTNFKVQVYVGLNTTIGVVNAPTFSGQLQKGLTTTLTATSNGPGKITFYYRGKRIAGCISKTTVNVSGTQTATCSFKPSTMGYGAIYASYAPNDSSYTAANSSSVSSIVLRRTNTR